MGQRWSHRAADYTVWRNNLGAGSGSGALASVPEPSGMLLAVVGFLFSGRRTGRRLQSL